MKTSTRKEGFAVEEESNIKYETFLERHALGYVVAAGGIGLLTAAFFAKSWFEFLFLVGFGAVFAMFMMWFVFMAIITERPRGRNSVKCRSGLR